MLTEVKQMDEFISVGRREAERGQAGIFLLQTVLVQYVWL